MIDYSVDVLSGKTIENEVLEATLQLMEDYVNANVRLFSSPYFHEDMENDIKDLVCVSCEDYVKESVLFEDTLEKVVKKAKILFFTYVVPVRSYPSTFIRKIPNKKKQAAKIEELRKRPQPEQRTQAWYKFRHTLITASSAWKALDTVACRNSLIFEKCSPIDTGKFSRVNTNSPMHWGQMFEPVSIQLYELKYNTKIEDFGCIRHDKYPFLGASPDGINVDASSERFGRMLEIKNIVNREINGIPKKEYWIQMQLQMEVCDLKECDFLETKFECYEDMDAFYNDSLDETSPSYTETKNGEKKGIFMCLIRDNTPFYLYPPLLSTKCEFEQWEEEQMEKNCHCTWVRNVHWRVSVWSCVLVLQNKPWFNAVIDEFKQLWEIVENEKVSGYSHRAPKPREKKVKNIGKVISIDTELLLN